MSIENRFERRQPLRPLLAKTALALVLAGANAQPAAAAPERTSSASPIVQGLKKLNHAQVNDSIRVLDNRTSSLYARKGSVVFGFSRGRLVKTELPQGLQIVHAAYGENNGRPLAFYRRGDKSYCLPLLSKANRNKIYENFYSHNDYRNEDAFRIKRFSPEDISTRITRVDAIADGDLFSRAGAGSDPYSGEVGDSGREMVRLAQATASPD